jgi:ankyrin repeat protein
MKLYSFILSLVPLFAVFLHAMEDQWPLLHRAVFNNDIASAQKLLAVNSACINDTDVHHNSPLHVAVLSGNEDNEKMVKYLVAEGANQELCNQVGYTPLQEAVRNDNISLVRILCKGKLHSVTATKKDTLLHIAALYESNRVLPFLVQQGLLIESKNNIEQTPLDCALDYHEIHKNRVTTIQLLLSSGASHTTSLPVRHDEEGKKIMQLLVLFGRRFSVAEYAFCLDKWSKIVLSPSPSLDEEVNTRSDQDVTLAMYAVGQGNLGLVKSLLAKKNIGLLLTNAYGQTIFDILNVILQRSENPLYATYKEIATLCSQRVLFQFLLMGKRLQSWITEKDIILFMFKTFIIGNLYNLIDLPKI